MSLTSPGWQHCIQQLRSAPPDSFDHKFGEHLASADSDTAWSLLVDVITDDPCATHEYKVAAHMLGHRAEVDA